MEINPPSLLPTLGQHFEPAGGQQVRTLQTGGRYLYHQSLFSCIGLQGSERPWFGKLFSWPAKAQETTSDSFFFRSEPNQYLVVTLICIFFWKDRAFFWVRSTWAAPAAYLTRYIWCLLYRGLLTCIQQCSDCVLTTEKQEPMQKCFRTFEILFKFVIQSRLLYARTTDGENQDDFRLYVLSLFATFNKVVSLSSEVLVPTQVTFTSPISNPF